MTKLHLVHLDGGFNDMFYVNVWFGVNILINYDFKSILIYFTVWEIFGVVINNSFWGFDGCGRF